VSKFVGALVLSIALCTVASAGEGKFDHGRFDHDRYDRGSDYDQHDSDRHGWLNPIGAPEIDPASAISGLTLLGAGLAVIRGRRFRK
jgi:hypothetical protein